MKKVSLRNLQIDTLREVLVVFAALSILILIMSEQELNKILGSLQVCITACIFMIMLCHLQLNYDSFVVALIIYSKIVKIN